MELASGFLGVRVLYSTTVQYYESYIYLHLMM